MNKYNRKCILCGTEYEYCQTCAKDYDKPIWYRNFHDENCRTIFYVLADYSAGNLSKDEAAEKLSGCDLSKKYTWSEKNQKILSDIFGKSKKNSK